MCTGVSWWKKLLGRELFCFFVFFCLRDDNSVERTDGVKGGKEILDQRWRSRNFSFLKKKPFFPFSFPYVSPPPFFFWAGLIKRRKSFGSFPTKSIWRKGKYRYKTNRLSRGPQQLVYYSTEVVECPCVDTAASHGPSLWTNQSVANISKSPFFFFPPQRDGRKTKRLHTSARTFPLSPIVFLLPSSWFAPSKADYPPPPPPLLQKRIKQLTTSPPSISRNGKQRKPRKLLSSFDVCRLIRSDLQPSRSLLSPLLPERKS